MRTPGVHVAPQLQALKTSSCHLRHYTVSAYQIHFSTEQTMLPDQKIDKVYENLSSILDMVGEEDSDFDNYNEEDFQSDLVVTATPAVVLEDGFDSLSGIYDDIRKDDNDDQLTLYESIAGSLLRLDKLEVRNIGIFKCRKILKSKSSPNHHKVSI